MTNHNDAIDRARKSIEAIIADPRMSLHPRSLDTILTDLAAEIRAEERRACMDEIHRDTADAHDRLDASEARLAAVRAWRERYFHGMGVVKFCEWLRELDAILDGKED